jgi:hypothetical protein
MKQSGGQGSFRIKPGMPEDDGKQKTEALAGKTSLKKKEKPTKAALEEEVTQSLKKRIQTKIKAMNMLIAGGKVQNYTDIDSISMASEKNTNFKMFKNPVLSRVALHRQSAPHSVTGPKIRKEKDLAGHQDERYSGLAVRHEPGRYYHGQEQEPVGAAHLEKSR